METFYDIRRVREADLPLLSHWCARPHVARWWGKPAVEPEREKLHDARVAIWIAALEGRLFAFIQDYAVSAWSPHHFDYLGAGARGMDVYIGERDLLGLGHGSRLVRQHVEGMLSQGAPAVGIDPRPDNAAARRAFEKAGFGLDGGPLDTRWSRAVLMSQRRER